jgi:hypothetical protein
MATSAPSSSGMRPANGLCSSRRMSSNTTPPTTPHGTTVGDAWRTEGSIGLGKWDGSTEGEMFHVVLAIWFLHIVVVYIYIYTQYTRISICRTTFIFYLFLCLFLLLYLPITKSLPLICAPIFFHPPTPAVKRTWAMGQGQGEACRVLE